jgi:hypothetical protein
VNEVRYGFRLRQVNLSIEKRSFSKLARFGQASTIVDERLENTPSNEDSTMAADLNDVLTGIGIRLTENQCHNFIQHIPARRHKPAEVRGMGLDA